jgi:hypothetical protein
MSTAALHMLLCTSQGAPRFCGDVNDLPRYLTEVEDLCQSRQRMTGPERIKYVVYYTDEKSWNIWDSVREVLADPASWEDFKNAMQDLYPRYEVVHTPTPLYASLPPPATSSVPLPVPHALLPSLLPAAAILLAPDAIQALLLPPAPLMPSPPLPALVEPLLMLSLPQPASVLPTPASLPLPAPLLPAPPAALPLKPMLPEPVVPLPSPAAVALPLTPPAALLPLPAIPVPPSAAPLLLPPAADVKPAPLLPYGLARPFQPLPSALPTPLSAPITPAAASATAVPIQLPCALLMPPATPVIWPRSPLARALHPPPLPVPPDPLPMLSALTSPPGHFPSLLLVRALPIAASSPVAMSGPSRATSATARGPIDATCHTCHLAVAAAHPCPPAAASAPAVAHHR